MAMAMTPLEYCGSKISILCKSEIRYEGIICKVNPEDSSIELQNVHSFGTEGRKKDGQQIPASDKICEYKLFRACDIKDLKVLCAPPAKPAPLNNDPVQSHNPHPASVATSLPSAASTAAPDPSSRNGSSGIHMPPPFEGNWIPYQPGASISAWNSSPMPSSADGIGLNMTPMYWPGYYTPPSGLPYLQLPPLLWQSHGFSVPQQPPVQYPGFNGYLPAGSPISQVASPSILSLQQLEVSSERKGVRQREWKAKRPAVAQSENKEPLLPAPKPLFQKPVEASSYVQYKNRGRERERGPGRGNGVLKSPQELSTPTVHEDSRYVELNVLERIVDGSEEPGHLNLPLLQNITENFSMKRKIGYGGCGEVYKGILRNGVVAVKRLFKNITIKDKMFHREVKSLITVKHENIVRFLGYCSFTEERVMPYKGGNIMVDIRERLLCFEYISNGSLENHITDELRGLEWHTRYKIIVGICKGLLYLHKEKNIIHMDLKPANILLDVQMVPKITDFGLARLDDNSQTTTTRFISLGYSAPEYILEGKSSSKADIYSLGVIIIELVTGSKKQPNIAKVLRKWRHRWYKSSAHIPLGYQQLTKCLLLGLRCTQVDPTDRPGILDVIDVINEIDSNKDERFQVIPCLEDMLDIKPLEIQFPFALEQQISHSIELTNDTDDYIAFRITKAGLPCLRTEPNEGIVPPQEKFGATLTMEAQDKALPNTESWEKLTVQSTRVDASLAATRITGDMFIETDSEVVDEVNVKVVFGRPPLQEES